MRGALRAAPLLLRLVVVAALAGAAAAGCGRREGGGQGRAQPDTTRAARPVEPRLRAVTVYLLDEQVAHLVPVTRYVEPRPAIAAATLRALLAGPTFEESSSGLTTAIPDGIDARGLKLSDSTLVVDLPRAFESGAGAASVLGRLAQLTWTMTALPGIARVDLRIDGRRTRAFSSEGVDVSGFQTPAVYQDWAPPGDGLPAIVILSPLPGAIVGRHIVARGTANVFGGAVSVRARDANGRVLFEGATTASCGDGCRGTWEREVALPADFAGELVLDAFSRSARDGSEMHRVSVTVRRDLTLAAGPSRGAHGRG